MVQNSGFESPAVANGGSYSGLPTSWGGNSSGVQVVDPSGGAALQASEGQNYVWLGSSGGTVTYDLGVIEADTVYEVKIDVGVNGSFSW